MATSTVNYSSSTSLTTTALESLASSSGLTAGWQSDIIDNRTNKYLDALVSGQIRTGTTPTANTTIYVYAWAQQENSGPTRPDSFGTTQATRSITSAGVGQGYLRLIAALNVDSNTTGRDYAFGPTSIASLFGGFLPQQWGIWVVHNTGVALNATSGIHKIYYDGIKVDTA
jgi:hypothetical protein